MGKLEKTQKFIGASELAVEAHFVAQEIDIEEVLRDGFGADEILQGAGIDFGGRGGVVKIKGVRGIAGDVDSCGVDEVEFAVDMGGFGINDAAGTPEAVDNLADKAKLKRGLGLEFFD